jgi:hypothetical protein
LRELITIRDVSRTNSTTRKFDIVEPRHAAVEQGAGFYSMPGGRLDDIEMDAVTSRTLQRPVFSAGAAGDHAKDD